MAKQWQTCSPFQLQLRPMSPMATPMANLQSFSVAVATDEPNGNPMATQWQTNGKPAALFCCSWDRWAQWQNIGKQMVNQWETCSSFLLQLRPMNPTAKQWETCSPFLLQLRPMNPMAKQWETNRKPIGNQWETNGKPMGNLQAFLIITERSVVVKLNCKTVKLENLAGKANFILKLSL